jgi:small multidrug resistance family-3 protein
MRGGRERRATGRASALPFGYNRAMISGSGGLGRALAAAVYLGAAALEVGGDALIRRGMRGSGLALVAAGFVVLESYGVVVNLLDQDFSRLLGAYVGVFAVVSVLVGRFVFGDAVPGSTWLGLAVILAGSAIVQLGRAG